MNKKFIQIKVGYQLVTEPKILLVTLSTVLIHTKLAAGK
jgi:hypothetical protein